MKLLLTILLFIGLKIYEILIYPIYFVIVKLPIKIIKDIIYDEDLRNIILSLIMILLCILLYLYHIFLISNILLKFVWNVKEITNIFLINNLKDKNIQLHKDLIGSILIIEFILILFITYFKIIFNKIKDFIKNNWNKAKKIVGD